MPRDTFPQCGQWPTVHDLPDHLRKLHRQVMRAAGQERADRVGIVESDVDEDGRVWPGRIDVDQS